MPSVYLLQHLHVLSNGEEDVKIIGIYSSSSTALAAIDRVKDQPGFSDFPCLIDPLSEDEVDGFYIDEYILDQDHWPEGFITI
jgi:hypothetical protein